MITSLNIKELKLCAIELVELTKQYNSLNPPVVPSRNAKDYYIEQDSVLGGKVTTFEEARYKADREADYAAFNNFCRSPEMLEWYNKADAWIERVNTTLSFEQGHTLLSVAMVSGLPFNNNLMPAHKEFYAKHFHEFRINLEEI